MRGLPLLSLLVLGCSSKHDTSDTTPVDKLDDTALVDSADTSDTGEPVELGPQQYYRLVEMSGVDSQSGPITITYEDQDYDPGLGNGTVPRAVRGFLWVDEDAAQMDLRTTVITNHIPAGIISGQGGFVWEEGGDKLVLTDVATWVYSAKREGRRLTLQVDEGDPRNEASPGVLDTYVFELEDAPDVPIAGDWVLTEREDTGATLGTSCGLAQNLIVFKLYGLATGSWSLTPQGGLDMTVHIQEWDNDTCDGAPLLDLDMAGTGLCEVVAANQKLSCIYNRTDQRGLTTHLYYEGSWTQTASELVVDVHAFTSDTTDPALVRLSYTMAR